MPKRSNDFQKAVHYIYANLAPLGATIEESAMVLDSLTQEYREVDTLIKYPALATEMSVAIECRDHSRVQSVEWIDAIIGKYQFLPIDKIIAVSRKGFSKRAKTKAASNGRVVCITAQETPKVDWARKLVTPWKVLSHQFQLIQLKTLRDDKTQITQSTIGLDGSLSHENKLSEDLYPVIHKYFFEELYESVQTHIKKKIASTWNLFKDGEKRIDCVEISEPDSKLGQT